jgi:hypothetical protein
VIDGSANLMISAATQLVLFGIGTLVACKLTGAFGSVLTAVVISSVTGMSLAGRTEYGGSPFGGLPVGPLILGVCLAVGCNVSRFCSNYPSAAWTAAQSVPALAKEVEVA